MMNWKGIGKKPLWPKVLSRQLAGGLRKTTVKIAGLWAEI
jgi:hypothetical protein